MIREIDFLLEVDAFGIVVHDDTANANNVREWLSTPQGKVYGRPSWGHELERYKHEPASSEVVAVNIEFSIIKGMGRDLPNVTINAINCEPHATEIDLYSVTIVLKSGEIIQEVV
ncbi:MAG: hypothetical protein ACRCZA_00110 [Shewanella sp.]|uniref:hypothetical protein n=1 Tax=Shewanella sp. TaxID=50422 RepID=UPI003F3C49D5